MCAAMPASFTEKTMRFVSIPLLAAILSAGISIPAAAQTPATRSPGKEVAVPADHWAYAVAAWLYDRHTPRTYPIQQTKSPAPTRQQFARRFAQELRLTGSRLESELAKEPRQRAALIRAILEFAPELRAEGMDVGALLRRISAPNEAFHNVPIAHWGEQAAWERVIRAGILIGYPDGTFRLDKNAR
jgi:hypothetical protein